MYEIHITGQFKKDLKRIKKRSTKQFDALRNFIKALEITGFDGIPLRFKPHHLIGNYKDCRECHIQNDLLLIWQETDNPKTIILIRTDTHSDLF